VKTTVGSDASKVKSRLRAEEDVSFQDPLFHVQLVSVGKDLVDLEYMLRQHLHL
jgi:hypothetical protein